jgi:hypothetical protein
MIRFARPTRKALAAGGLLAALAAVLDSPATARDAIPPAPLRGVSHRLYVSLAFDPAAPARREQEARATLTALVRISDHASDSRFFGTAFATFTDFAVGDTPPERLVWKDTTCHQDRGLPKISVVSLNGLVKTGETETVVAARPRHIGKHLPADEIVPQQAFKMGTDQEGRYALGTALTHESRVRVTVKLYTITCSYSVAQ